MDWSLADSWMVAPAAALVLSALFTWAACHIAPRLGLVDRPDGGRKCHQRAMPVMGGAAFCSAILCVLLGGAVLRLDWISDPHVACFAGSLLASAVLFCALGVIDDRIALRPRHKLLGQVLASLPFALSLPALDTVQLLGLQLPLGPLLLPCVVLWLVACSNVINLMDGLDGLAGTVGLISMLTVAVLFFHQRQTEAATIALVVAASLAGFLLFNWPPARIFMGDGGSLTTGFLIGAMAIRASSKTATSLTLAVPLVLISIPIFDTLMAILRRKLNGRGIGEGDRCHIHHRLQDRGLSRKQALLMMSGLSLVMAAAALTSALTGDEWTGLLICIGVLSLLIAGRIFGHAETTLFLRHVKELGTLLLDTSGALPTRFLLARLSADDFQEPKDIWQSVSQRVQQLGGTRLEFHGATADGEEVVTTLAWTTDCPAESASGHEWEFRYSVPREPGLRATLSARGLLSPRMRRQRLDDLFRLFARVCEEMPLSDAAADLPAVLPLPETEPATERRRAA